MQDAICAQVLQHWHACVLRSDDSSFVMGRVLPMEQRGELYICKASRSRWTCRSTAERGELQWSDRTASS